MKSSIATLAMAALLAGGTQRAAASDREWATAGKILTGVVAGTVIAGAFERAPVYSYQPATWYAPPPPVYVQPAPVYYARPYCAPGPVYYGRPYCGPSYGYGYGGYRGYGGYGYRGYGGYGHGGYGYGHRY